MVLFLLTWYFLGGGTGSAMVLTSSGVDGLAERTAVIVEDETRRKAAVRTLKGLEKDVRAFEKAYTASGKQLNKLYRDHDGGREEALFLLDALNAQWAEGQKRALDARFALRKQLTEEEWSALFGDGL